MICPKPHSIVHGRERLKSKEPLAFHSQTQQPESTEAEAPRSKGTGWQSRKGRANVQVPSGACYSVAM